MKKKTKVLRLNPLEDRFGEYIPYCDYKVHRGISLRPEICENRQCIHYVRLYINNGMRIETQMPHLRYPARRTM